MTHSPDRQTLLELAVAVARAGGQHTLRWYQAALEVERKADGTPVTLADRDAERVMRARIVEAFPDHSIVGEETGATQGSSDVRWILDPIDGTKAFVAGVPLYSTLVGVEVAGEPVVGVIYLPVLDELVAAARGLGCTWNGRPCRVSSEDRLDRALLLVTDQRQSEDRYAAFGDLTRQVRLVRTWADAYAYALVATGRAEVAIDPAMDVWDSAALLPILEEAGGRFTDWRGRRTIRGRDAVATNGALHDDVLAHLSRAPELP